MWQYLWELERLPIQHFAYLRYKIILLNDALRIHYIEKLNCHSPFKAINSRSHSRWREKIFTKILCGIENISQSDWSKFIVTQNIMVKISKPPSLEQSSILFHCILFVYKKYKSSCQRARQEKFTHLKMVIPIAVDGFELTNSDWLKYLLWFPLRFYDI